MPKPKKLWELWEEKVQKALGLRGTISSGSKFYDLGDGVTPIDHPIPFIIDAKSTEKNSYSVNATLMQEWENKAAEQGQMFGLPIRFEKTDQEYMVVSFEDFQTLWWRSKKYLEDN